MKNKKISLNKILLKNNKFINKKNFYNPLKLNQKFLKNKKKKKILNFFFKKYIKKNNFFFNEKNFI